jgi:hypothetical protein
MRRKGLFVKLQPIETAPTDGTYILLFGPSGYIGTPLRCEVCRHNDKLRPHQPWVNHAGDSFTDGGESPTHWAPLPKVGESSPDDTAMLEEAAKRIALALRCKIHRIEDGDGLNGKLHYKNAEWLESVTKSDVPLILRELRHTTWKQAPHEVLKGSFPVVLYFATEEHREEFIGVATAAMPTANALKL